jgi:phage shock protein E
VVRKPALRCTANAAVVLALLALAAAACGDGGSTTATIETVSAADAYEIIASAPEGLVVLDVRGEDEYAAAHIPGAINIDFFAYDFESRVGALDRSVPYVVYCLNDNRSADARLLMEELGFMEVYEINGGIVSWAESGLPLSISTP